MIGYYEFHGNVFKVEDNGLIYGLKGRPLKQYKNKDGYLEVCLIGNEINNNGNLVRYKVKVHTIMAKVFLDYPDDGQKYEVNHKDCDRTNNKKENLEYLTHYENIQYSIKFGNHKNIPCVGENNIKSKLTEKDVIKIRNLHNEGHSIREIYNQYYKNIVSENTIGHICNRKTWNHI